MAADRRGGWTRPVCAGAVANLAAGTLFAWSLVAGDAVAGVAAPRGATGVVFASAIVVFSLALLGVGRAPPWLSPRRLLLLAAAAGGGGLVVAATAAGPVGLWWGIAVLFGTANGLAYGVALALAARTPVRRRGTATGVVVAAYALGPVVLGLLAPASPGADDWRAQLAVLGAAVAALLAAAAFLAPAQEVDRQDAPSAAAPAARGSVSLLWLVLAGGTAPALLLFAYAVPLAARSGLGAGAAGLAVSSLAAGNLVGRVGAGWWSDRVGRIRGAAVALVTAAVSIAALVVPGPGVLAGMGFFGTGLAYGAVSALVPAATADRVGSVAFPRAYAKVFTAWGFAGLVAPLAGEAVLRLHERQPALLALIALPLLPAAVALVRLSRRTSARPRT